MQRLDVLIYQRKLTSSREKAIEFIKLGAVRVEDKIVTKPGLKFDEDVMISVVPPYDFVSRAGQKLEFAIRHFDLSFSELHTLDIGASTGGFTDCMLKYGASSVVALDVGHDQLDEKLRRDERVIVVENTNIRDVSSDSFSALFDAVTIDVSFISIKQVLPVSIKLLKEKGFIMALLKPQFEAGIGQVGKNGVFRSRTGHLRVLREYVDFISSLEWKIIDIIVSPIQGGNGNIEYLTYLRKDGSMMKKDLSSLVESAFSKFSLR